MKFKIGDEIICACGNCNPCTIMEISGAIIFGVDKDGREMTYILPDDEEQLRKVTKLGRALK